MYVKLLTCFFFCLPILLNSQLGLCNKDSKRVIDTMLSENGEMITYIKAPPLREQPLVLHYIVDRFILDSQKLSNGKIARFCKDSLGINPNKYYVSGYDLLIDSTKKDSVVETDVSINLNKGVNTFILYKEFIGKILFNKTIHNNKVNVMPYDSLLVLNNFLSQSNLLLIIPYQNFYRKKITFDFPSNETTDSLNIRIISPEEIATFVLEEMRPNTCKECQLPYRHMQVLYDINKKELLKRRSHINVNRNNE